MANPSKIQQRRREFTPLVAMAFIELGYRGTTTAQLARRCGVRENVLYRVWPTKKAMFLDAVEHVYAATMRAWAPLIAGKGTGRTAAERILDNQAAYHGKMRLYRIVFAGLVEDDPEIKSALRNVYSRFHGLITGLIEQHRRGKRRGAGLGADLTAWAMLGLGAVIDMQRELEILPVAQRKVLMRRAGTALLEGPRR